MVKDEKIVGGIRGSSGVIMRRAFWEVCVLKIMDAAARKSLHLTADEEPSR